MKTANPHVPRPLFLLPGTHTVVAGFLVLLPERVCALLKRRCVSMSPSTDECWAPVVHSAGGSVVGVHRAGGHESGLPCSLQPYYGFSVIVCGASASEEELILRLAAAWLGVPALLWPHVEAAWGQIPVHLCARLLDGWGCGLIVSWWPCQPGSGL